MTITIGDLIIGLFDVYEREYADRELATVKTALVVDDLLRAHGRQDAARSKRTPRAGVRGAA
jgi:hypothetical protein